jgi:hypothetical protein
MGKPLAMDHEIDLSDAASEQPGDLFVGKQGIFAHQKVASATRLHLCQPLSATLPLLL